VFAAARLVEVECYRASERRSRHDKLDQRLLRAFEMRAILANCCNNGLDRDRATVGDLVDGLTDRVHGFALTIRFSIHLRRPPAISHKRAFVGTLRGTINRLFWAAHKW
jgi:hypothetical protein